MKNVNLKLFLYNLSIAKFVLYIKKYKEKVKVKHISLSHFSRIKGKIRHFYLQHEYITWKWNFILYQIVQSVLRAVYTSGARPAFSAHYHCTLDCAKS